MERRRAQQGEAKDVARTGLGLAVAPEADRPLVGVDQSLDRTELQRYAFAIPARKSFFGEPTMAQVACPSCLQNVSDEAPICPHCGHPLKTPRRSFFGRLVKWCFVGFNLIMLFWLISYLGTVGELYESAGSEAGQAGTAIGGTIGTGFLVFIWALGTIILGIATLLTRPKH
jgi:hypothetical protein